MQPRHILIAVALVVVAALILSLARCNHTPPPAPPGDSPPPPPEVTKLVTPEHTEDTSQRSSQYSLPDTGGVPLLRVLR